MKKKNLYVRTLEMLTVVVSESIMSRTKVQLWYKKFKQSREDVNNYLVLVARARQQPMKVLNL